MDNKLSKIIGERIGLLLSERKIKQKDLAEHLGITDNTISYFCSGKRMPNTTQIKEISQFFNISADYLLGISSAATNDKDIQYIGDYLKLSAEAIENLHSWADKAETNVLNFMLESVYPFTEICSGMEQNSALNNRLHNLMKRISDEGKCSESDIKEFERLSDSADLLLFRIQQSFNTLVEFYCGNPRAFDHNQKFWQIYTNHKPESLEAGDPHGNDQETE